LALTIGESDLKLKVRGTIGVRPNVIGLISPMSIESIIDFGQSFLALSCAMLRLMSYMVLGLILIGLISLMLIKPIIDFGSKNF